MCAPSVGQTKGITSSATPHHFILITQAAPDPAALRCRLVEGRAKIALPAGFSVNIAGHVKPSLARYKHLLSMKNKTLLSILILVAILLICYWFGVPEQGKIDLKMRTTIGSANPLCNTSESFRAHNCSEYLSTKLVTTEEWEILFPEANFYLIEIKRIQNFETNMNGFIQSNRMLIKQGLREYKAETYHKLLQDNQIVINGENLELVLSAFARISAANYYTEDITFSELQEVNYEGRYPYNYHLSAVAGADNIALNWFFVIQKNQLRVASYQSSAPLQVYIFSP